MAMVIDAPVNAFDCNRISHQALFYGNPPRITFSFPEDDWYHKATR
jgi:hypothetical protein